MERIGIWLRGAEKWLDGWGNPGWIAAIVLGFVFFGPFGLLLLGYALWRHKLTCKGWKNSRRRFVGDTGNTAFDEYRRETLRRLEEERDAFVGFLGKLRAAKDRAEFEQFMDDRRKDTAAPA